MTIDLFQTNFPTQITPVVDAKAQVTTPWMAFFRAVYNRTGQGNGILYTTESGIAGAGTTQATATALGNDWNEVATTSVGGGVILPSLTGGQQVVLFNNTGGNLNIYPPVGGTITFLGASLGLNNPHVSAAPDFVICYFFSSTDIQLI